MINDSYLYMCAENSWSTANKNKVRYLPRLRASPGACGTGACITRKKVVVRQVDQPAAAEQTTLAALTPLLGKTADAREIIYARATADTHTRGPRRKSATVIIYKPECSARAVQPSEAAEGN